VGRANGRFPPGRGPCFAPSAPDPRLGVGGGLHHEGSDGGLTEGYVFGVNALHGGRPDVPYDQALVFWGTRYYPDLGYAVTFSGAAEVDYAGRGLQGADLVGTVEAYPFYDGSNLPPDPLPPITIDVDLTWTGTGSTHSEVSHYAGGSPGGEVYVFVDSARWRYADVSGTATIDGQAATVDYAQVLAETAGEFNLVVLH